MTIQLVSVAVGKPQDVRNHKGEIVRTGIWKAPLATEIIQIERTNIAGDQQADLVFHGGPDKAIYVYPGEHYPWWQEHHNYAGGYAAFGENLTTLGITEPQVRIGDTWQWGSATLQVSQPRLPCYKLAIRANRTDMVKVFTASLRSGWYLRVLQPGTAAIGDVIKVIETDPVDLTVEQAFRDHINRNHLTEERRELLRNHSRLSAAWRNEF